MNTPEVNAIPGIFLWIRWRVPCLDLKLSKLNHGWIASLRRQLYRTGCRRGGTGNWLWCGGEWWWWCWLWYCGCYCSYTSNTTGWCWRQWLLWVTSCSWLCLSLPLGLLFNQLLWTNIRLSPKMWVTFKIRLNANKNACKQATQGSARNGKQRRFTTIQEKTEQTDNNILLQQPSTDLKSVKHWTQH